jgi:hypothetical protein
VPLRTVIATRYVTPLREGGSLPAVVEGNDDGLYVLKFRGAGQGPKALVAELIGGELARTLGLDVPEIVYAELDADLARTEPDAEIQDLIRASAGCNLALDFLPGAVAFDLVAHPPDGALASTIVWLDGLISNIDRTPRNPNLLVWHRRLWLIDHGAALYFQHDVASGWPARARQAFAPIRDHVLLPRADRLETVDEPLAARLTPQRIEAIVALVPDAWLIDDGGATPSELRAAYVRVLTERLRPPRPFMQEALRARSAHL